MEAAERWGWGLLVLVAAVALVTDATSTSSANPHLSAASIVPLTDSLGDKM